MQENKEQLTLLCARLLELLLDITVTLIVSASHSGKTIRIIKRFAKSYGFDVYLMMQTKSVILTLTYADDHSIQHTAIRHIPDLALNFYFQNMLSRLSWYVYDNPVELAVLEAKYREIIAAGRYPFFLTLIATALANMGFCRLFGGDLYALLFVFLGTAIAFYCRSIFHKLEIHPLVSIVLTAFISSLAAGCTVLFSLGATASIALATSVLFLIPGVPLLNALIEILEGHVLNGIEKLIHSCTIIVCIALGLLFTLVILGIENL